MLLTLDCMLLCMFVPSLLRGFTFFFFLFVSFVGVFLLDLSYTNRSLLIHIGIFSVRLCYVCAFVAPRIHDYF